MIRRNTTEKSGQQKKKRMEEKTFGGRLKKLRKEANITQNDFADKLLVHSQTVSRWERG
ncbi:MAG: helix-turn-helix transcriptional regulator, partial [Firmicutes bacterium]|nr:helix-turn-helix transcriptional regulator [Bacillota bacterium]